MLIKTCEICARLDRGRVIRGQFLRTAPEASFRLSEWYNEAITRKNELGRGQPHRPSGGKKNIQIARRTLVRRHAVLPEQKKEYKNIFKNR